MKKKEVVTHLLSITKRKQRRVNSVQIPANDEHQQERRITGENIDGTASSSNPRAPWDVEMVIGQLEVL